VISATVIDGSAFRRRSLANYYFSFFLFRKCQKITKRCHDSFLSLSLSRFPRDIAISSAAADAAERIPKFISVFERSADLDGAFCRVQRGRATKINWRNRPAGERKERKRGKKREKRAEKKIFPR